MKPRRSFVVWQTLFALTTNLPGLQCDKVPWVPMDNSVLAGYIYRIRQNFCWLNFRQRLILCIGTKISPITRVTFQEVVGGACKLLCAMRSRSCECVKIFTMQKNLLKNFSPMACIGENFHAYSIIQALLPNASKTPSYGFFDVSRSAFLTFDS